MALQKNDFIEIEFTGRLKEGGIFDSNIKEDMQKLHEGHDHPIETKPFIFCLGQEMFLKGIEDFLIGKNSGQYEIELKPENAFGLRQSNLVQTMPMKVFVDHKINPVPGTVLNFDNKLGKVLTVSGGRVMVDFNNPLAGKEVIYKVKVLRKVEDINEKVKSLNEFLFRTDFKYTIQDKKLILEVIKQYKNFIELFKDKYKEMLGLDLEVKEIEDSSKTKQ